MHGELVTVIIPFYNAGKTLGQSIDSVLDQHYKAIEIILVNDGSTDSSLQVANSFTDGRIKIISQEQQGVACARNIGIEHSTGKFICFLDADDIMTPTAISSRMNVFNEKMIDIVGGAQEQRNFDLSTILSIQTPSFRGNPQLELVKLNPACFINCGTWLIRRETIGESRFPIGWTHSEDLAFFFIISKNVKLDYVTNIVQIYRRHANSAMSNLMGLEIGYSNFIELVKTSEISLQPKFILRFKASKILLLSYWSRGEILNGVKAFCSIWRL
jgi:glycosyltransferase involved in cell wall biosynthesis